MLSSIRNGWLISEGGLLYMPKIRMKLVCELIYEDKMVVVSIYMHQSLTCSVFQKN